MNIHNVKHGFERIYTTSRIEECHKSNFFFGGGAKDGTTLNCIYCVTVIVVISSKLHMPLILPRFNNVLN